MKSELSPSTSRSKIKNIKYQNAAEKLPPKIDNLRRNWSKPKSQRHMEIPKKENSLKNSRIRSIETNTQNKFHSQKSMK